MHNKVFPEEWYTVMEDAYPGEVDQKMQPWLELEVQDHLNFGLVLRECWCCKYGGHRGPCEFRKMPSCDGHVFAPVLVCVGRALKISSDLAVKP